MFEKRPILQALAPQPYTIPEALYGNQLELFEYELDSRDSEILLDKGGKIGYF
jgi:hypothetical protein